MRARRCTLLMCDARGLGYWRCAGSTVKRLQDGAQSIGTIGRLRLCVGALERRAGQRGVTAVGSCPSVVPGQRGRLGAAAVEGVKLSVVAPGCFTEVYTHV